MRAWILAVCFALAACGRVPSLPAPPPHPNGGALWRIVHEGCVPHQRETGRPAPCVEVELKLGEARGWALLKDRNGVAQMLLLPTARITGIEDPQLLDRDGPDFFAAAWSARRQVESRLPRPVPDDYLAITVNSIYGRSQDQLHLHIDCLSARAAEQIHALHPDDHWRPVAIGDHRWLARQVRTLSGPDDPFRLLARSDPGARGRMGAWTLAVTSDPRGEFIVLADRADPTHGDFGSAEALQDHACRLAAAG